MNFRFIDSTAPFDFVAKNGYYQIGDVYCANQITAYQQASRTKQPVKWHFNDEVYNNFNWRSRLNLPITELYRIRAQQLRDKYDYLILWFSGGADSTTALQSFVDNNIHLDEVMIAWPCTRTQGKYTPSFDPSAENIVSEWDYSIKPQLEWLSKNHPNVKITILDQLATPDTQEDHADTWTIVEKHGFATINRQRLLDKELQLRYKQHKNIACISGSAPPEVSVLDNKWLAVTFNNNLAAAAMAKSDFLLDGTPRNVEYFFWTPDLPELVREQGHIILDFINAYPQNQGVFLQSSPVRKIQKQHNDAELRRNLIKKLVYPKWNLNIFQANKPKDGYLFPTIYNWFHSHHESNSYLQAWSSALRSQYSLISDDLLPKRKNQVLFNVDYPILLSKFHVIGRIEN